jgi:hypothetical protein
MSCSLVTVICNRDLALYELQAESISKYLEPGQQIVLAINENDPTRCLDYYHSTLSKYLENHSVTIFTKKDFDVVWDRHYKSHYEGWANQQIIKLIIADKITTDYYLVLDSQNFLYQEFCLSKISNEQGKYPYRTSRLVMPTDIWNAYSQNLNYGKAIPDEEIMSICTPIYFNTNLISSAIEDHASTREFVRWFSSLSKIKSEFIWYYIWAETHGGIDKYHYYVKVEDDWAQPYLRDGQQFDQDFKNFITRLGIHAPNKWASINHRSWGDMSDQQYTDLVTKLGTFGLNPNFDHYRKNYVAQD